MSNLSSTVSIQRKSVAFCFIWLVLIMFGARVWAAPPDPCSIDALPKEIQEKLATSYSGWKIVTLAMMRYDNKFFPADLEPLYKKHSRACLGMIKGKFSTDREGYVFVLAKPGKDPGKKIWQQVIYFHPNGEHFEVMVLAPPLDPFGLPFLQKLPPGKYDSVYHEHVVAKTEVIAVSSLDSSSVILYCWTGDHFKGIQYKGGEANN